MTVLRSVTRVKDGRKVGYWEYRLQEFQVSYIMEEVLLLLELPINRGRSINQTLYGQ